MSDDRRIRELNAINNVRTRVPTESDPSYKPHSPKLSKSKRKKVAKARWKRYNQRVWKGWDRTEKAGEVVTYRLSDLKKD